MCLSDFIFITMKRILTLLQTKIYITVRSRQRTQWDVTFVNSVHTSGTQFRKLAAVDLYLSGICRYIKQILFNVSSFSDYDAFYAWRIFPSVSLSPSPSPPPSPFPLSMWNKQHEGAHLEQPLGQSLWGDDKSFLRVHWNLGYSSRTLCIPASTPGQDCTNTTAIWRKQAGRRWVISPVQDSDPRLIVMC